MLNITRLRLQPRRSVDRWTNALAPDCGASAKVSRVCRWVISSTRSHPSHYRSTSVVSSPFGTLAHVSWPQLADPASLLDRWYPPSHIRHRSSRGRTRNHHAHFISRNLRRICPRFYWYGGTNVQPRGGKSSSQKL